MQEIGDGNAGDFNEMQEIFLAQTLNLNK